MRHSRSVSNKINRLHERVLRIVYNDFKSSFENLLEKNRTVVIPVKILQTLATEIFKISKDFSVPLMSELFHQKVIHYNLRNPYKISIPNVNSVFMDKRVYRTSVHYKTVSTVLKTAIRKWKPNSCLCRLCKSYIGYAGFIYVTCLGLIKEAGYSELTIKISEQRFDVFIVDFF